MRDSLSARPYVRFFIPVASAAYLSSVCIFRIPYHDIVCSMVLCSLLGWILRRWISYFYVCLFCYTVCYCSLYTWCYHNAERQKQEIRPFARMVAYGCAVVQEQARLSITHGIDDQDIQVLATAMICDPTRRVPRSIRTLFKQTGTYHVIAVSGSHIAAISFFVMSLLQVFRRYPLLLYGIVIGVLGGYGCMIGWPVSCSRSFFMMSILFIGQLFHRKHDIINSLFCTACIVVFLSPDELFSPGFQLSFCVVASLIIVSKPINLFLLQRNVPVWLSAIISNTLAAWFGSWGLIAWYFQSISFSGLLANSCVIPLSSLAIILGIVCVFSGWVFPECAFFVSWINSYVFKCMIAVCAFFSTMPGGSVELNIFYSTANLILSLVLWVFFIMTRHQRHR